MVPKANLDLQDEQVEDAPPTIEDTSIDKPTIDPRTCD